MVNNRLVLNRDKTHLLILSSSHCHRKHGDLGIHLNTGNEIVLPQESERLLGVTVTNNFQWNMHTLDGEKSILKSLIMRNNALSKLSHVAVFKTRKMVANGLVNSDVHNLICNSSSWWV